MNKETPGCLLILGPWVIAFLVLVIPTGENESWWQQPVRVIFMSVAGMLYLAGVISWGIYGAVSPDLEIIQKQNREMIDLLRRIADSTSGPGNSPLEVTLPITSPILSDGTGSHAITSHPPSNASTSSPPTPGKKLGPEELGY